MARNGTSRIGLTGLGTMGAALAQNIAGKGFAIAVHNRSPDRTAQVIAGAGALAERMAATESLADLAAALARPRAIVLMVPAGAPVDSVIAELRPHLEPGDLVIDAGNADFNDTRRREAELAEAGIGLLGLGVSGGAAGARHGPSMMAGGSAESYAAVADILEAIAARYQDSPCVAHLGPDGAGHFVKTVHNGIEYAEMQLIAEVYGILRDGQGQPPEKIAPLFAEWNRGPLHSYLVEITAEVLAARDPATGRAMVEVIADSAGQKGTGRWTLIEALRLGQSATTIEAAVGARVHSAAARARAEGARLFPGDGLHCRPVLDGELEQALLAARIVTAGQGFALLAAASEEFGWELDLARVAEIWRAGCIIRSAMLDDIARAVRGGLPEGQLMFAPHFADRLRACVPALRRLVGAAVAGGLPVPALSAALSHFDTMRQARGTADLIQAQRDFFGAHGFARIDAEGTHHGPWGGAEG